jgi:protein SCO1/2
MRLSALLLLAGCGGPPTYIVEGVVREVLTPTQIVVQHAPIAGLMDAKTMPFEADADATGGVGLRPGDTIFGRLEVDGDHWHLTKIRVTGHDPSKEAPDTGAVVAPGWRLAGYDLAVGGGETWRVGEGQEKPTLLTFFHTICSQPDLCPATMRRLQELQARVRGVAHLVAVSFDPEHDTPESLARYATAVGAEPETWRFVHPDRSHADALAVASGLAVTAGQIEHGMRFLVLDRQGRLIERYDDNRFALDRVVEQLTTGGPPAPTAPSTTPAPKEGSR